MTAKAAVAGLVALVFFATLVGGPAPVRAERKRRVAVLEVRSAKGASDIGPRLAQIMRRTTSTEVVDPDDARRRLGGRIEEDLARCAGEPACVAKIGARLKVDEIILVGVSELGGLIVALQVIEVKTGKVRARVNESLPEGSEPDDTQLEGFLRRLLPREAFRRFGTIRVTTDVVGADVDIGGVPRGRTPIEPVVVEAPEIYDVRVRKSGHVDFKAKIEVPPDATIDVSPQLPRRGSEVTPWYGKWWVWAIAGTVVTGAIIGTVAVSGDPPANGDVFVDPF